MGFAAKNPMGTKRRGLNPDRRNSGNGPKHELKWKSGKQGRIGFQLGSSSSAGDRFRLS